MLFPSEEVPKQFNADEQLFLTNLLDAFEAQWIETALQELEWGRELINSLDSKTLPQSPPPNELTHNPVDTLILLYYPNLTAIIENGFATNIKADCLRAACHALLIKARDGAFPEALPATLDALTKRSLQYKRYKDGFVISFDALPNGQVIEFRYP